MRVQLVDNDNWANSIGLIVEIAKRLVLHLALRSASCKVCMPTERFGNNTCPVLIVVNEWLVTDIACETMHLS